ncbi:hypothetical protein NA56DRAFT_652213 [Hyaloscypha hepaticicola]|uniref:Uncharacterized protein n=1 Tax=Hyaloscypha hepaticicola TaxID=2082293 RepID=A0A2J6PFF4_9HELO|nr:hypothetical protein NA56DRAFT_652213 [Hyaloscypha hepaticicola]
MSDLASISGSFPVSTFLYLLLFASRSRKAEHVVPCVPSLTNFTILRLRHKQNLFDQSCE